MEKANIKKQICPHHQLPIDFVCCSNHCEMNKSVCQKCISSHKSHSGNIMSLQKFYKSILTTLQEQNKRDISAMKENDLLRLSLYNYKRDYDNREQKILTQIIKGLDQEKQSLSDNLRKLCIDMHKKNATYFQKLNKKKVLAMRIKFASPKGLQYFDDNFIKYKEGYKSDTDLLGSLNFGDTLTLRLKNFIKLKISKKDALKLSEINLFKSKVPEKALPPLSPRRNKKQEKMGKQPFKLQLNQC